MPTDVLVVQGQRRSGTNAVHLAGHKHNPEKANYSNQHIQRSSASPPLINFTNENARLKEHSIIEKQIWTL